MGTVSVSLPSDGETIEAADYNTPLNTIVNEINGNLDNNNIKSGAAISTAKLASDAGIIAGMIAADAVTPAKRSGGFFIGSTSITSTGNKVITGVGFTPKLICFLMSTEGAVASGANAGISIGFATSSSSRATVATTTRNANGGVGETLTSKAFTISTITAGGGSRSVNVEGDLVSMDSDGFTINVSTYNGTKTLVYVCFG